MFRYGPVTVVYWHGTDLFRWAAADLLPVYYGNQMETMLDTGSQKKNPG